MLTCKKPSQLCYPIFETTIPKLTSIVQSNRPLRKKSKDDVLFVFNFVEKVGFQAGQR